MRVLSKSKKAPICLPEFVEFIEFVGFVGFIRFIGFIGLFLSEKLYDNQPVNVVEHVEQKQETKGIGGIVRCFHGKIYLSMLFCAKRQAVRSRIVSRMVLIPSWINPDVSK